MEAAEFIIEGDASKAVSEMYRLEAANKQLQKSLKQLAADSVNNSETHVASLRKVAGEYAANTMSLGQARAAVKSLTQAKKELTAANDAAAAAAAADAAVDARRQRELQATGQVMMTAADKAMRFNMVMGQLSYAASDFLSVSGGVEVRLRAMANNLQMIGMLIPGPWGLAINVLTIASQAAISVGAAFFDTSKKLDEHKTKVQSLADYYEKLSEEVIKATQGEEAFDMARRKREMDEVLQPERKKLRDAEFDVEYHRKGVAWAEREGLDPTKYRTELKDAIAEKVKIEGEIKKVEADFAERERGIAKKALQQKAEKFIGPAEDDLGRVFLQESARMGRDSAFNRLKGNIGGGLSGGLRGADIDALAKSIAEKSETDLAGKRLKEQFDGRSAEEAAVLKNKEEQRRAKIAIEEAEYAADANGKRSNFEKRGIKELERFLKGLEIAGMKLEEAFEGRKEADRVQMVGPRIPRPVPIDRNGNL